MNVAGARARVAFWALVAGVTLYALAPGGDAGVEALSDKGRHFLAFAVMAAGGATTAALPRDVRTIVFWLGVAIGIETLQGAMGLGRDPSVFDAIASFAGALFGLAAAPRARDFSLRDAVLCASLLLAATCAADIAWRVGRPAVTHALLTRAWTAKSAAPWPGAPANLYARIDLPDAHAIPVVDRATPKARALAPGLWTENDARRPGAPGVTILMGHRNAAFRALGRLETGDDISLWLRDGARFDYVVTRRDVVRFDNSRLYPDTPGEQIALVTCWPVDATEKSPWRLVVYAERRAPTHAVLSP